jgi:hypothetical protein
MARILPSFGYVILSRRPTGAEFTSVYKKSAPIHLLSGVRSVLFLPVCTIVPFSDAWDGHPPHVAEKHALVANAVAKDTVHLPPGEG